MFFKNNFQKYGIILPIENLLSLILRAVKQRLTSLSIYTRGRHRWISETVLLFRRNENWNALEAWGRGGCGKTSNTSLHMMYPDCSNRVLWINYLHYKFPIRSTLNYYLLKKIPYRYTGILALNFSYNLFKVLINHQTVGICFNWNKLFHNQYTTNYKFFYSAQKSLLNFNGYFLSLILKSLA